MELSASLFVINCNSPRPRSAWRPNRFPTRSAVDQRHQKAAEIGNDRGENIRRGGHPLAAEEGAPLSSPRRRKFVGQSDRCIEWCRRAAPIKRALYGFDQAALAKLEPNSRANAATENFFIDPTQPLPASAVNQDRPKCLRKVEH